CGRHARAPAPCRRANAARAPFSIPLGRAGSRPRRTRGPPGASPARAAATTTSSSCCRRPGSTPRRSPLVLLARHQPERRRVEAVALAGRLRAVRKDMAEMRVAAAAQDLRALHGEAAVGLGADRGRFDGGVEARPAGAGIVLGGGVEQRLAAADADVGAGLLAGVARAGEGPLSALAP